MHCYTKHRQNLWSFLQGLSGSEGVGEPGKEWEEADSERLQRGAAGALYGSPKSRGSVAAELSSKIPARPSAAPLFALPLTHGNDGIITLCSSLGNSQPKHRCRSNSLCGFLIYDTPPFYLFGYEDAGPRDHNASGRLDLIAKLWANVIDVSFSLFRVSGCRATKASGSNRFRNSDPRHLGSHISDSDALVWCGCSLHADKCDDVGLMNYCIVNTASNRLCVRTTSCVLEVRPVLSFAE